MTRQIDPEYAMGRTDTETQRLIDQEVVYGPSSRAAFREAGIGPGMKVLDIGTGPGSLALMAAEIVGPQGSVIGVDSNPAVLETARKFAERSGLTNVSFEAGDFRTMDLPNDFDAITGRYVLMYQADPVEAIRDVLRHLKVGGRVVFQDWHSDVLGDYFARNPGMLVNKRLWNIVIDTFAQAGIDSNFGGKLHQALLEVGLSQPGSLTLTLMGGPADWIGFKVLADTVTSVLPLAEKLGMTTAQEEPESYIGLLREECVRERTPTVLATPVSAWAFKI